MHARPDIFLSAVINFMKGNIIAVDETLFDTLKRNFPVYFLNFFSYQIRVFRSNTSLWIQFLN